MPAPVPAGPRPANHPTASADPAAAGGEPAAAQAPPPAAAGRYALGGEIARGGMGAVYRATDAAFGREVAVKVLLDEYAPTSGAARRFRDEARITGQLQHPGIPPVFDLGELPDGRPFLAMKLIKGDTLDALLRDRPDPAAGRGRLAAAFEQACQAVAYAHARGVVHRDLKPANVMVGSFGEVQVMDWGLAKVLADARPAPADDPEATAAAGTAVRSLRDSEDLLTRAGSVLGTPAYMPPEQAVGAVHEVDARSDVFGLGGILAAILTGRPPFVGDTAETTRVMAARGELGGCYGRLGGCGADPELVALCKRCLSPKREDRPADAGAVAREVAALRQAADDRARRAELDRVKAEGAAAAAAERAAGLRRWARLRLAVLGLAALLAAAGGAFAWHQDRQAAAERGRLGRNAEAVAALLDQAEAALKAGDVARAAALLDAAGARAGEGGAEESDGRRAGLRADLGVLRAVEQADRYRLTPYERTLPDAAKVAARYRAALGGFGADPDAAGAEAAAARAAGSVVRDRLVGVLDYLLWQGRSPAVRSALRAVDPDPFRDAVRDARAGRSTAAVVALAGRPEAAGQPPGFVALLGTDPAVPVEVRRGLLGAAVGRRPADLGLLLAMGYTYLTGRADWAGERARWFQAAVAAAPDNPVPHRALGIALLHLGDLSGSERAHREALRLDPKDPWTHYNLGAVMERTGDLSGSERAYREALRLDPTVAWAHHGLGVVLVRSGDLEGAERAYREALRLDPAHALAHHGLGVVLERKGDQGGAERAYREALRLDPAHALAHANLGSVLSDRGDLVGAAAEYREAIRHDPGNAGAHAELGSFLRRRGDLDGAVAAYRAATRRDPTYAPAWYEAGYAQAMSGDLGGALATWRELVGHDPKFAPAHNGLAWVLAAGPDGVRDGKGAVEYATTACELTGWKNPYYFDILSAAYAEVGDFGRAAELQEKALTFPGMEAKHGALWRDKLRLYAREVPYRDPALFVREMAPPPRERKE